MVSCMKNKSVLVGSRYAITAYFLGISSALVEPVFAESVFEEPLPIVIENKPNANENQPNASQNQWRWLEFAASRSKKSHYQGILVHSLLIPSKGIGMNNLRVDHGYVNGEQRELITTQDGAFEQYYKQGSKLIQLDGYGRPRKLMSFESAMMFDLMSNKNEWSSYYKLVYLGAGRFAERKVYKFAIKPEVKDRFSYALWLDQVSGVVLNYAILQGERTIEQFYYTEFTLNKHPSDQLVNFYDLSGHSSNGFIDQSQTEYLGGDEQSSRLEKPQTAQGSVLQLPWLPEGFVLSDIDSQSVHSQFYSDGLASFSVFIHSLSNQELPFSQSDYVQGATAMTVHSLGKSRHITLVGELPQSVLAKIGKRAKILDEAHNKSKLN